MKRRLFLAITLVGLSGCAAPPPAGQLLPADFAYGQTFNAPAAAPFVRVTVPDDVFTQTAWPDVRDIRAFNAGGEPVPFARMAAAPTTAAARRIPLRSFKLEQMNPGRLPRVELDAGSGALQMRVVPGTTEDIGSEYLLATAEADEQSRIDRLILSWNDTAQNWQQRVTVSVSSDLQSWMTVAFRRPLMDVRTTEGERLTHREVTISNRVSGSSGFAGRYWRLQFDRGFVPTLRAVEAEEVPAVIPPPAIALGTRAEPQRDGSVIYRLSDVQPVTSVRLEPSEQNTVLPVHIEARRDDKDKWQFVASTVFYRVNSAVGGEQASEPIRLNGQLVGSFRVRPFGTTWGSAVPQLWAERDAVVLIVNARGAGPFLLAWGSRAAADTSVDLAMLVPGGPDAVNAVADATLGAHQQLGGPDRLTAIAPAERAARWQTALVWIALVGGAGALAFLALRLLRETRVTP